MLIKLTFDKRQRSLTAVTPVKCERDIENTYSLSIILKK